MVSSRDRRFVSVEIVWLGLSPGRRRLRFSFQINDVKDPIGFRQPRRLRPAAARSGVCSRPAFLRQPKSSKKFSVLVTTAVKAVEVEHK